MERIAFIFGETFLYWSSIMLTLAVVTGICVFLALYLGRYGNGLGAALTVALAVPAALILARLVHWYCRTDSYLDLNTAMTDFRSGGFSLLGAFAGCLLAAALVRLVQATRNLPSLLDCMALAAGAAIPLGRLASLFNSSDRGVLLESMKALPFAYGNVNNVTGQTEYRLAVFMIQAMITAVIFAGLLALWLIGHKRKRLPEGDICLVFLGLYFAAQCITDSMRYDALAFRSNGFVSVEQIVGLLTMITVLAVFSVRLVKHRGFQKWYIALWAGFAALCGGAGFMEYYVQRHGDQALFAYSIMSACLACAMILMLVIRFLANRAMLKKAE